MSETPLKLTTNIDRNKFCQYLQNGSKLVPMPKSSTQIGKAKVFYGQKPPSGESTTTECGFNYQLLAVMY